MATTAATVASSPARLRRRRRYRAITDSGADLVVRAAEVVGEVVQPGREVEVVHESLLEAGAGSGCGASRVRSVRRPMPTCLFTVLAEQPMRRAVSASLRSSK